ncbi:MAG: hypothetical protein EXR72_09620 [Myxococcales bacterium]|nr:hypothetical protein [Myxococcales bacterium]
MKIEDRLSEIRREHPEAVPKEPVKVEPPSLPPVVQNPPVVPPPELPPEQTPIYKKWWLWAGVGGVAVVGILVAVLTATLPSNAAPQGEYSVAIPF